jgi:hypothetical protein
LNKVVHCGDSAIQADVTYLAQLLMSVLENLASGMVSYLVLSILAGLNNSLAGRQCGTERDKTRCAC